MKSSLELNNQGAVLKPDNKKLTFIQKSLFIFLKVQLIFHPLCSDPTIYCSRLYCTQNLFLSGLIFQWHHFEPSISLAFIWLKYLGKTRNNARPKRQHNTKTILGLGQYSLWKILGNELFWLT